jgi:transposase
MKFILTGGQEADCLQALPLLEGETAEAVLADKGYDAAYIVDGIAAMGAEAVIPSLTNRKILRDYDRFLYKERNLIERTFGKLKHFRAIATRYSKLAISFMAFLQLAAILLWLK